MVNQKLSAFMEIVLTLSHILLARKREQTLLPPHPTSETEFSTFSHPSPERVKDEESQCRSPNHSTCNMHCNKTCPNFT
jgi:hypothetical protein